MFSKMEDRFGKLIGRKGDSIKFDELPIELQTESLANTLGATITFDDNTLQNIFSLTNRYVYAMLGPTPTAIAGT